MRALAVNTSSGSLPGSPHVGRFFFQRHPKLQLIPDSN
jgi:hypothetical protein